MIEIPGYDQFVRVGAGASGIVYRAHQLAFGDRVVAVKVIPDSDVDETTARRFRRECLSAGKLSWHPNVVSVYDAGVTDEGIAFLVMEYLESGSLADRLRSRGAVPWHQAVDAAIRIAGALGAAHAAGLVHRDVKPENILVGPYGEPKLGDFGIAFIEGRSRSRTGSISGTIAHSAPETLSGNATESADIYALGSTLYTLLAGTPAFVNPEDHSITPLITRIATAPVPDLRPGGVPDSLAEAIERSMAKDPADRWPTAQAFGEALQEVERRESQVITPLLAAPERSDLPDGARGQPDVAQKDRAPATSAPTTPRSEASRPRVDEESGKDDARGDTGATVVLPRGYDVDIDRPVAASPRGDDDGPTGEDDSGGGLSALEGPSEPGPDSRSRITPKSMALVGSGIALLILMGVLIAMLTGEDETQSRLDLAAGDCFDGPTTGESLQVTVVDCTEPHDAVVYATVVLGEAGEDYPGSASTRTRATDGCTDALGTVPPGQTKSQVFPDEAGWNEGSRLAVCMLSDSDGDPLPPQ